MTHWPEQPNPAEPYLKAAKDFAKGGISEVIGHHDPLGDLLQSDAANTAIGMAGPLKGGDVFAQRILDLVRKLPDTGVHQGKVAIGELYDAYRKAHPREYESPKSFGYRLVNAAKDRKLNLNRLDLPETMSAELRQRSATPWDQDTVHFVRRPNEAQSDPLGNGPLAINDPLSK